MQDCHQVFLGLGSNLGDRHAILMQACAEIEELIGPITGRSALYVTKPWGFVSTNDFLNAVVCCQTMLSPRAVLHYTQLIERRMGRTAKSENGIYHDRTVDIDILLYDHIRLQSPGLLIPHPLMQQRDFVLRPLLDVLQQLGQQP